MYKQVLFFFSSRRRHTMSYGDWSSDVCSSDLLALYAHHSRAHYGTEETTTTGTVIEYKWRNPHVFVVWEVKDQSKSTQWVRSEERRVGKELSGRCWT